MKLASKVAAIVLLGMGINMSVHAMPAFGPAIGLLMQVGMIKVADDHQEAVPGGAGGKTVHCSAGGYEFNTTELDATSKGLNCK